MTTAAAPDKALLDEIIRRVVGIAHPKRIILFGSAARGEMGPSSDVDLLVIKTGPVHRRRLAQAIHRGLWGVDCAVDVVVATEEDVVDYGDSFALVLAPALKEGRVIYAA